MEHLTQVSQLLTMENLTKERIESLVNRLKKIGIEIELFGNYPWIYLDKINGKKVTEKFEADHGFTIAFLPARKDQKIEFTDIKEIISVIRKYSTN